MLPYAKIQGGNITATASTPQDIQISSMDGTNGPSYFKMRNITQWGATSSAKDIEFWWERSMAQGTARGIHQASGGAGSQTLNAFALASDGISVYSTQNPITFAPLAATAITAANGPVVSMTNTGTIAVGDRVRITNAVGMQQISGYSFQVTAVSTNTSITLGMADFSAFAAPATAATVTKYIPNRMYPRQRRILSISQANPCVVTFGEPNDFTVGEEVSFRVVNVSGSSSAFGMTQINNLKGVVASVTNTASASSITVNINTSGFTAFAFPTSAQAVTVTQPALCVPAGSGVIPNQNPPGTNLLDAFDNRNIFLVHLGATIFANSSTNDVWEWEAYYYDEYNNQ